MFRIPAARVLSSSSTVLTTKCKTECCQTNSIRCFWSRKTSESVKEVPVEKVKSHQIDDFFPEALLKMKAGEDALKDEEASDFEIEPLGDHGRCWEMSDLHNLTSPTLHNLWYVLLKERNRMLTLDAYLRQHKREKNTYYLRLKSVQTSIENLKAIIHGREDTIATVRTYVWYTRLRKLLGEESAKEIVDTYTRYTMPFHDYEKRQMKEWKHEQLFSKEYHRYNQPYEETRIEFPEDLSKTLTLEEEERLEIEKQKTNYEVNTTEYNVPQYDWDTGFYTDEKRQEIWREKIRNYESEDYVPEDDWSPGLEGFLHDIKREDWEDLASDPEEWIQSRRRREEDRKKIIQRIWDQKTADAEITSTENIKKWKLRVEGTHDSNDTDFSFSENDEEKEDGTDTKTKS